MIYRDFQDIRLSGLGFGAMRLPVIDGDDANIDEEQTFKMVDRAMASGINYYDLAAGDGSAFALFGEALSDVRDRVMYQIHFGADYSKGTYGWSLDLDTVKQCCLVRHYQYRDKAGEQEIDHLLDKRTVGVHIIVQFFSIVTAVHEDRTIIDKLQ